MFTTSDHFNALLFQEAANAPSSADNRASETGGEEGGKEKPNRGDTPDAMPMIRQVYYNSAKTSCPVHGHGTGPSRMSPTEPPRTSHPSHAPPPGSEPLPGSKPGRPDEPNRMFLPPHEPPLLPPYLMHPRDAPPPPYPLHPLDKRQADYFREQGRQVSPGRHARRRAVTPRKCASRLTCGHTDFESAVTAQNDDSSFRNSSLRLSQETQHLTSMLMIS